MYNEHCFSFVLVVAAGVTENKLPELHDEKPQLNRPEVSMDEMVGTQVEVVKSAGDNSGVHSVTPDHQEALELKENLRDEAFQFSEIQPAEQERQLYPNVSDEALQVTQDPAEAQENLTTNEEGYPWRSENQLDERGSPQSHLILPNELLEVNQDPEDSLEVNQDPEECSLEVNENVTLNPHFTTKPLEQESRLAVCDAPICYDVEPNEPNAQSDINQESNYHAFQEGTSNVSAEVVQKDATQPSGSNVDNPDPLNAEDSRKTETIAVDSAIYSISRSKEDPTDVSNIKDAEATDMLEELKNGDTWLPNLTVEPYTAQKNHEVASPGISGTLLEKIFSGGSKEKSLSENRLFSDYEFPGSSSVSNLYGISFCSEYL